MPKRRQPKRLTREAALRLAPRPAPPIEAVTRMVPQFYLPPVAVSVARVKFLERAVPPLP